VIIRISDSPKKKERGMAPGAAFHRPFGRTAAPDARRCRARWWIASAASIGVGAATGCVTIPQYDSKTDDMLTGLQKDTDTFIGHLSDTYDNSTSSGKACAYPANIQSYKQFRLTLGRLKTRAAALYANTGTEAALNNLQATYDALENAHKQADTRPDHCILPALLATDQQALDSAIGGLLKLELAKKGTL
jgi:hypothetical protein